MYLSLSLNMLCQVCEKPIDRVPDPELQRQIVTHPHVALAFGICPKCCTIHEHFTDEDVERIAAWVHRKRKRQSRTRRPK